MSFILDALKKSETDRQQQTGGEFSTVPTSPARPRPTRWFWLFAALLAINVAVLLGILLRPDVRTASAPEIDPTELVLPPVDQPRTALGSTTTPTFADQVEQARRQQPKVEAEPIASEVPAVAPPPQAASTVNSARVPTIDELRLDGSLQLPELHIDIHVFSDRPGDRFVFINMVKHREQSRLAEGPVVREITTDGVILQYQGRSFLLPRE